MTKVALLVHKYKKHHQMNLLPLAFYFIFVNLLPPIHTYILHTYTYPNIPFSAGLHHIHAPMHFMEAHGFALPGFKITDTCRPQWMGDYVVTEFNFTTHFGGTMRAKIFSGALDTSHIIVRDCGGEACMLGRLKVRKHSASGHVVVEARGDLLRPARVWERLIGGQRLVRREGVERAIKLGYSNFKNDENMMLYSNFVFNAANTGLFR
jgi:hypothetical protein